MSKSTIESLPNEIWLIIFSYLSSFDICQAFLDIKNTRIEHLLTSMHHILYANSMHYDQVRQIENEHNDHTNRFLALIHTVVLGDSRGCKVLEADWETRLNKYLLSIKKLVILDGDHSLFHCVSSIIRPLFSSSSTLRHLHIVFSRAQVPHSSTLSEPVHHQVSIRTMILEVEKVQLTLSIQQPKELTLLLKRGALPATEHLNVTNEEMRTALPLYRYKPISNIQLCEHELRKVADGTRLRSLVLRYINLKDAVILMDSLTMPLLEKLIFVDLYDRTLDHVGKFQELCSSTYLPALKDLHFSFCFPQEMEHGWQMSSFSCNGKWPFDNHGCYLDDSWISVDGDLNSVTDPLFAVYKRPINVLLQHKRTLHNHRLVEHAIIPIVTNGRRSLDLTCDQTDQPDKLLKNLQVAANSSVNKIYLTCEVGRTNIPVTPNYPVCSGLLLRHLRSITFNFKPDSTQNTVRIMIVEQILDASPNLSHLVTAWKDFRHCSKSYSNLKHLRLIVDRVHSKDEQYFNVRQLTQLVPHLRRLETGGTNIMLNTDLVNFVLEIIREFHQLIELAINKGNLYESKEQIRNTFKESLITAVRNGLFDCNNIRIDLCFRDWLYVWL
ncbi:unnamed protein product [Rotaria magnacalcarata]